jgi:hypothetical protein
MTVTGTLKFDDSVITPGFSDYVGDADLVEMTITISGISTGTGLLDIGNPGSPTSVTFNLDDYNMGGFTFLETDLSGNVTAFDPNIVQGVLSEYYLFSGNGWSDLYGGNAWTSLVFTATPAAPTSGYASWQAGISWNPGDDQTETGDPDSDGIENFLEYALDLDPLVASQAGLPTLTPTGGGNFSYDFNNAQPGVTYDVLTSSDLVTWSDPPFATLTSESTTPVAIPAGEAVDGRLFVRLRVAE